MLTQIVDLILETEKRYDHKLSDADRNLLASSLYNFLRLGSAKFVKGAKEHGGNLTERNCLLEMDGEVLDLWFYLQAARKQRKES